MPDFFHEEEISRELFGGADDKFAVLGLDEAGRGPLAGPVVAAAAWLDPQGCPASILETLDDSKRLSAKLRGKLYRRLCEARDAGKATFASSVVSAREIDELNILEASLQAMARAAAEIPKLPNGREPAAALVDGNRLPTALRLPARYLVKGDSRSFSIAAASVVAKVERDAIMDRLAQDFPGYGWERNRGYGTRDHLEALRRLGVTPEHRRSFRPVREAFEVMP